MTPFPPKLLLDECVPRKLAASFPEAIEVTTVPKMGWGGLENGELLQCAADHGFTAFITIDRNIQSQQNLDRLPVTIVLLEAPPNNLLEDLQPLVPRVVSALRSNPGKTLVNVRTVERQQTNDRPPRFY